jgi:ribosomal protein L37E
VLHLDLLAARVSLAGHLQDTTGVFCRRCGRRQRNK